MLGRFGLYIAALGTPPEVLQNPVRIDICFLYQRRNRGPGLNQRGFRNEVLRAIDARDGGAGGAARAHRQRIRQI